METDVLRRFTDGRVGSHVIHRTMSHGFVAPFAGLETGSLSVGPDEGRDKHGLVGRE